MPSSRRSLQMYARLSLAYDDPYHLWLLLMLVLLMLLLMWLVLQVAKLRHEAADLPRDLVVVLVSPFLQLSWLNNHSRGDLYAEPLVLLCTYRDMP